MTLTHSDRLWLLAALPLLAVLAARATARRTRDWSALGQDGRPAREDARLWLLGLLALVVALSGPRWGRTDAPAPMVGRDVVLALDVSRSMGALDAVPDRLGVAVEAAESLVRSFHLTGDRVAVVAFAGRGVLRCPLTADLGAVIDRLHALRPGAVRPGGTDLGAGLDAALDAFDDQNQAGGRSVVVFSDGEDHATHWKGAADRLRVRGIPAHMIALGDDSRGHPVPADADDPSGPLRYQGAVVLSKRSDEALSSIARETGGAFVPLGLASTDLGLLFQTRIEPVALARMDRPGAPERGERFGLFLLVGLGLILLGCRLTRPSRVSHKALAAALVALSALGASPNDDPASAVAVGRSAYDAGKFAESLAAFRTAARLAPNSAVPRYDGAATLFRLGRFEEARAAYLEARRLIPAGSLLRTKIDFALGNTALALGETEAAVVHYDDCLQSPARGIEPDRVRRDAAINRRFAEEQAPRAPTPDNDPGGNARKEKPSPSTDEGDPNDKPSGSNGASGEGGSPTSDRRGAGGAGGGGHAPRQPGTPEEQLARALEHVRKARDGRLAEPVEIEASTDLKDW